MRAPWGSGGRREHPRRAVSPQSRTMPASEKRKAFNCLQTAGVWFAYGAFLKGETSGFPSQTHPFPESLCVTPKWRVLPLIIAPAFVLRCNTGSITSGILTSHLAYCSTSVHPRDFCRFGFCSYRAKVHSHAVLRARTLAVLASVRVQTVIGSLCLQTTACSLRTQNTRKTSNRLQTAGVRGRSPCKGRQPVRVEPCTPFLQSFF